MQYENPVLPGFHPDPSVCRAGEEFLLATSSFEYFPGVPLYRSRNLVDWEPIGHALTREAQLPLANAAPSEGIFAPTIRHHEGTYYLVTTNVSDGGHFLVTADDPAGAWSDPTWIDAPGIDPDLFFDDGTVYFTYRGGEHGIEQATLDPETGALGEPRRLCNELAGPYTEAPHLYRIDGTYYLVVAEGGTHTRHMVSVARADHPTGPFEPCPHNPVLSHRGLSGAFHPIQATGHGDLVRATDGSWWLVFLGIRQHGEHPGWHHLGRETFLAPVTWRDGWPVVNGGDPVDVEMVVPETDLTRHPPGDRPGAAADDRDGATTPRETDPFAGGALGPRWEHRYAPERDRYAMDGEGLALHGGPRTLDDRQPTFVGRRQDAFDCRVRVELSFDPDEGDEAGLAAVYDGDHHYDLGVTRRDGTRRAVVRLRIGDASEEVAGRDLPDGPVTLDLAATTDEYRFGVDCGDGTDPLATARSKYLATEVAGGFTGVYLGVYATGDGTEASAPARFRRFSYRRSE